MHGEQNIKYGETLYRRANTTIQGWGKKNNQLRMASAFLFDSRPSFYVSTVLDLADTRHLEKGNTHRKAKGSIYASPFTPMERRKLN
jgi:hypothetical protein